MIQSEHKVPEDYSDMKSQVPRAGKPQRVKKSATSSNNLPKYRSVIFQPAKQSFSLAECDTTALDALSSLKDPVSMNSIKPILKAESKTKSDKSDRSKGIPNSRVIFQQDAELLRVESMNDDTSHQTQRTPEVPKPSLADKRKTSMDETPHSHSSCYQIKKMTTDLRDEETAFGHQRGSPQLRVTSFGLRQNNSFTPSSVSRNN